MGDWVAANKGQGPWPFSPQPEKCGYVNNPRWTATPASEVIHEPCGYWPKGVASPHLPANLYGLTTTGGEIWAAYYDGAALSWVGSYDSPIDADGLAFYNGNLITLAGVGATAVIREVTTAPPLSVAADHAVLLTEDFPIVNYSTTILYAPDIEKYFVIGGSTHGRIVRLSKTLAREARGVNATVVTGTDGNLYLYDAGSASDNWNADRRPITGASWNTFWSPIADNVCDGPITAWGSGTIFTTYGFAPCATYHNGYLYIALGQSVGSTAIRKLDPSTLAIVAHTSGTITAGKIIGYGNRIYVAVGTTTARVKAYNASDLTEVADSGVLPYGRFVSGVGNADMAVIDGRLIVTTVPYTDNSALYALDPTTLATLDVVPYSVGSGGPNYQCLARIDDQTAVIAENNGVGIAYLDGLRVPDGKTQLLEEAVPPYLSFGKYGYTGFSQQWVLAQAASDAGASPPVSTHCGTSPVWPMPA
jgi:hypothetical protein